MPAGVGRAEDERDVVGRLLERLEEDVPALLDALDLVDDEDLAPQVRRGGVDARQQVAHVVDLVVRRGVHLDDVERACPRGWRRRPRSDRTARRRWRSVQLRALATIRAMESCRSRAGRRRGARARRGRSGRRCAAARRSRPGRRSRRTSGPARRGRCWPGARDPRGRRVAAPDPGACRAVDVTALLRSGGRWTRPPRVRSTRPGS